MDKIKSPEKIDHLRRRVIGAAAITFAAVELGMKAKAAAGGTDQSRASATQPAPKSFGPLKQIDAGVLSVSYAELGPTDGAPVILLHGWPYDIQTYVDVAPLLASKSYRVIVPYLRGHGATRFLSHDAKRNGQQSALTADTIALMDALGIERATIGGCDWGARPTSSPRSGRNAARRWSR